MPTERDGETPRETNRPCTSETLEALRGGGGERNLAKLRMRPFDLPDRRLVSGLRPSKLADQLPLPLVVLVEHADRLFGVWGLESEPRSAAIYPVSSMR